jgi:hypothetical protein
MHVPYLEFESRYDFAIAESLSWWDPDSQCTLVISSPSADPELWMEYLRGADHSYRKHGVEQALDVAAIRDGSSAESAPRGRWRPPTTHTRLSNGRITPGSPLSTR